MRSRKKKQSGAHYKRKVLTFMKTRQLTANSNIIKSEIGSPEGGALTPHINRKAQPGKLSFY